MINSKKGRKINKLNLLLSLIIAFAGWVYVVYNVNPTMTRTYTKIPVEFVNEDVLMANELAISDVDIETVDVTIEGKRSVLYDAEDRISVTADVANAGKGENTLALNVTVPNDAKVLSQSNETITVTVEGLKSKTVSVIPRVMPSDSNGSSEPMILEQSEQEATVSGAESLVDKVASAECYIDGNRVEDTEKNFTIEPVPVNRKGRPVKYVKVNPNKVVIAVINSNTKKVNLKLNVLNPDDDEYMRTYTGPDSVVIKGDANSLANVESIESEQIDISDMQESGDVDIKYILPQGVEVSEASLSEKLHVSVLKYESREVTISASSIEVTGTPSGFEVSVIDDAKVVVKGKAEGIASFKPEEFTVTVDAGEYTQAGEYYALATLRTAVPMASLKTSTIKIELKSSEGEN